MYKRYDIDTLPQVPDCSSISQLPHSGDDVVDSLSSNTLVLISQPTTLDQSDTGYLSKKVTIGQLSEHFKKTCHIDELCAAIDKKLDISSLHTYGTIKCDEENPYVISSFHYDGFNLSSVQGYRLSSQMNIILKRTTGMNFVELSQLNERVKTIENRISSVGVELSQLNERVKTIENRISSVGYVMLEPPLLP